MASYQIPAVTGDKAGQPAIDPNVKAIRRRGVLPGDSKASKI